MNENMGRKMPEYLYQGDPRVCVLLGRQKPPAEGESVRRSCFVYILYIKGIYLLFHTLTRKLLILPPQFIDYFIDDRLWPSSVLLQDIPAKLYEEYFLVPEHTSESQLYLELKNIIVLKEELPREIINYVILPTTACNARCFYCFEQGMKYHSMDHETVEDTIRFILAHKPADNKKIHIHWFGGEPMCAENIIDRICTGLSEADIEYTAEMTSNGSLFTEETVKRAADIWKVEKIQITLDGMEEEYARRKRYSAAVKEPFETVIRNIHLLISGGIKVVVRLNVDVNNVGEIYRVTDFLKEEFTSEEKKKMQVYAHSLFSLPGDGLDICPVSTGDDTLETHVLEINDYIQRMELMIHDLDALFVFKSHYCMVTAPECNVLIDADGKLFACDAMPEDMHYGDVKKGIDQEAWNRIASPCSIRSECKNCAFLPLCTDFDRCPNRTAYDSCFKLEKRKLERELSFAYNLYLENQQQNAEFLKQKEISNVSD